MRRTYLTNPSSFHIIILFTLSSFFFGINQTSASQMGWSIHCSNSDEWKLVSGDGSFTKSQDRFTAFAISNTTATWRLTTEPIWIYKFSELKLRYRFNGASNLNQPVLWLQPGSIGPVTPGANNLENPLARSGAMPLSIPPGQINGQIHEFSVKVHPTIKTDQIDQITVTLQSLNQPVSLEIFELSFINPDLQSDAIISLDNLTPLPDSRFDQVISPLILDHADTPLSLLTDNHSSPPERVQCAAIPFQMPQSNTIHATDLSQRGAIELDINQSCSEIFLLMSCDLVGTDDGFGFSPRTKIIEPERLIVQLEYDDGAIDHAFPYNLNYSGFVVNASQVCSYVIPCHAQKTLQQLRIVDMMSYGRVILLAASINAGAKQLATIPHVRYPKSLPSPAISQIPISASIVVQDNRYIKIDNHAYRMEIDARSGCRITSLYHKIAQKEMLSQPSALFALQAGGLTISPDQLHFETFNASSDNLELVYSIKTEGGQLGARVNLKSITASESALSCIIENHSYNAQSIRLRFPDLQGLKISPDPDDDFYLYPRKRAAWSNQPVKLGSEHSGEFPLQFMDLYSESLACGIALHSRDQHLIVKKYLFEKDQSGVRMAIEYGANQPITIKPKQGFATPPSVLQFHSGDWHAAFQSYKTWCNTWYQPNPATRSILKDVFICRRDYPIGGTGYLFDLKNNHYTLPDLIEESNQDLGGIDMIDISSWAYSEKFGRVGEYEKYELGGKEDFRQSIQQSHDLNIPVGLYFESYLLDPRSTAGSQYGKDWQVIDKNYKPKTWQGNEEMYMCAFAPGWRNFLSQSMLSVANDTGVDAVYMDQYGYGNRNNTCFAPNHNHPLGEHPILGEHGMLRQVRQTLNKSERPVALYTEQVPNDISSQYVDAAFDYSFWGGRHYQSQAKLHLFRFAFPSFKVVQLFHPGIDPRAASAEDAKLCFFYGEAMWLKGRAKSWFSSECRQFISKSHRIFQDHIGAFTAPDVEPMIPTHQPGLYANRFTDKNETIITLYNATPFTIRGLWLTEKTTNSNITNLWDISGFSVESSEDNQQISGTIHPHQVSCLLIKKM